MAGNSRSAIVMTGGSNFAANPRDSHDYYATDPKAVDLLLKEQSFSKNIWEPACGEGHISKRLIDYGFNVRSTDLIYRGFGEQQELDFLKFNGNFNGDIITNPPYKYAKDFIEKALDVIPEGNKVAMLLRIQFLEGVSRRKLFDAQPPKFIYVASSRLKCALNADFTNYAKSAAICFAWFVWVKGSKSKPVLSWIN